MFGLFDDYWGPRAGGVYHVLMFSMMLLLVILVIWMFFTGVKSGFSSDPLGGLSSGAALRFAGANDTGVPGGVVAYSGFTNPEPPVFYDIGDVNATRSIESAGISSYSEGLAEGMVPTIGRKSGFAPTIRGKSGFDALKPNRWQQGFTDAQLFASSQGKM